MVLPAIAQAERAFAAALNEISIDQLVRRARASYNVDPIDLRRLQVMFTVWTLWRPSAWG